MAWYLDTSAAVKLVVAEPHAPALRSWLAGTGERLVSSDLLRTELLRATRRAAPDRLRRARAVLDGIDLLTPAPATFERAAELEPAVLRSLDALHLATALELGDDLDGIVVYDRRLAEAAARLGLVVQAPV